MTIYYVKLVKRSKGERLASSYLLADDSSTDAFNAACKQADKAHRTLYPDRDPSLNIRSIIHKNLLEQAAAADAEGSHGGDLALNGLGVTIRYSRQVGVDVMARIVA